MGSSDVIDKAFVRFENIFVTSTVDQLPDFVFGKGKYLDEDNEQKLRSNVRKVSQKPRTYCAYVCIIESRSC